MISLDKKKDDILAFPHTSLFQHEDSKNELTMSNLGGEMWKKAPVENQTL